MAFETVGPSHSHRDLLGAHRSWTQALAFGLLLIMTGCDAAATHAPASVELPPQHMEAGRFQDYFTLVASVVPEQSEEHPIIRVSGAVLGEEFLAVADVSEADVKVFSRHTGERLAVLGGPGQGPGEFEAPRYLLLEETGDLVVGDAGNSRLSRWALDSAELVATMRTDVGYLGGLVSTGGGTFVALSAELGGRGDVLAVLDSDYRIATTLLSISGVLPRSVSPNHPWANLRTFQGTALGDTVFVTSSISDSLWAVVPETGTVQRRQLVVPGYRHPDEPEGSLGSPSDLFAWAGTFHTAAPMKTSGDLLYMPFVQGVLNYGDAVVLVVRDGDGEWFGLSDAPPLVAAHQDEILVIGNPMEDPLRFDIYQWRGR